MKAFLIAILIMSLLVLLWQGLTQAVPDPTITLIMILLIGPISAVALTLRRKKRRTANGKI
jgi:EamA domain-containing membrane protein RarD